jgi:hypothetical protein
VVTSLRSAGDWVLLSYRLPREPSTPRIAVWRRLKHLGVAQLSDGLVALPMDARNREQLEWVAEQVEDAGGQAAIWIGHPATRSDEDRLISSLRKATATEYRTLIDEIGAVSASEQPVGRRTLSRFRRELRRIRQRDYFPPPEAEMARHALDEVGQHAGASP